jgi:predicted phage tail protein
MRKIHLHGALAKHGEVLELDVQTAGEAVVAIAANFPDFLEDLRVGSWVVMRGDPDTGICLDEEMIPHLRLGEADLHIMPEVMGAKRGGILKAVLGVALIAVSFGSAAFLAAPISTTLLGATTWGNAIGQLGLAMTLAGVATMLAPETESTGEEDSNKSYTLSGPQSTMGQGHGIQIVYGGPVITGGMMISGGMDANGLKSVKQKPKTQPTVSTVLLNPFNDDDNENR